MFVQSSDIEDVKLRMLRWLRMTARMNDGWRGLNSNKVLHKLNESDRKGLASICSLFFKLIWSPRLTKKSINGNWEKPEASFRFTIDSDI